MYVHRLVYIFSPLPDFCNIFVPAFFVPALKHSRTASQPDAVICGSQQRVQADVAVTPSLRRCSSPA